MHNNFAKPYDKFNLMKNIIFPIFLWAQKYIINCFNSISKGLNFRVLHGPLSLSLTRRWASRPPLSLSLRVLVLCIACVAAAVVGRGGGAGRGRGAGAVVVVEGEGAGAVVEGKGAGAVVEGEGASVVWQRRCGRWVVAGVRGQPRHVEATCQREGEKGDGVTSCVGPARPASFFL